MDKLSLIGGILALCALLLGSVLKGAGIEALWSPAAFVIVVVGTFAAIMIQTHMSTFMLAWKLAKWVFLPPSQDRAGTLAKIVEWSNTARKQGLLGLEAQVKEQDNPFIKKGLQMVVDGIEPDSIRNVLETEMHHQQTRNTAAAKVFEGMGIYAPTLGIIGAVLGLIAVMKNLADPSKLGHGIAAAFTATIYGIGLANLLFLPMASKLKALIAEQNESSEMVLEGLIAIAQGENPRNIESRLSVYVQH
ncbi:chemotaxis protein MotA [Pseudoxanthomonas sp. GM95]|uniref:flagellar motor protein n=1 Tax=Pseudoxanthomonas sp. GM95 TaxID=1881043 RepID=UPI0008C5FEDC|nr:flagellar motor protein [Pseudoxanthomonas sp. GM95]SEK49502.1 chemotaxis protein MotA [Pseudoxanthomonas sp. GM95]